MQPHLQAKGQAEIDARSDMLGFQAAMLRSRLGSDAVEMRFTPSQPSEAARDSSSAWPVQSDPSSVYSQGEVSTPFTGGLSHLVFAIDIARHSVQNRAPSENQPEDFHPAESTDALAAHHDPVRLPPTSALPKKSIRWSTKSKLNVFALGTTSEKHGEVSTAPKKKRPFNFAFRVYAKVTSPQAEQPPNRRHTMTHIGNSVFRVGMQLVGRKRARQESDVDNDDEDATPQERPYFKTVRIEPQTHCAGCQCHAHRREDPAPAQALEGNGGVSVRVPSPAPSLRWARHDVEYYRRLARVPDNENDTMDLS